MSDAAPSGADALDQGEGNKVEVWDLLTRLFHWSLVAAFSIAFLAAEEFDQLHELAGYVVAGLLAFRFLWGFVGGKYARWTQFLKGPAAVVQYLREIVQGRERRHIGHNPAGAAMIVALFLSLSGAAVTGWLMEEAREAGAQISAAGLTSSSRAESGGDEIGYRYVREGRPGGALKELHEAFANLALLLVLLHVGGGAGILPAS